MRNIISNPYAQKPTKIEPPKRKGAQTAEPSPDDITRSELEKHLRNMAEGKPAEAGHETKFNDYLQNGNSYGYLDDASNRNLFSIFAKKQLADNNADNLVKLCGPDSVFGDYIERRKYKPDSLESQLFDYVLTALKQKQAGKDPVAQPVSLTAEGLEGFIDHLTDKDKGLSHKATKLEALRTSSDPMLRLLRDAAMKLGLRTAIDTTKEQLKAGQSSAMTEKLSESVGDLLKKEEAKLNEILPSGGGLVVARKADGTTTTIDKIDISGIKDEALGEDKGAFERADTLDFGDFFRRAHRLSLVGSDEAREELLKHVSDGISLILAYHKAETKAAETANDNERLERADRDFKLISRTIQGKGLLPTRLANIIRSAATEAIMSDDFRNRAAAGDISGRSKELREKFVEELNLSGSGGNRAIASLSSMNGLMDNGKIVVFDPESFAIQKHDLRWVESAEISNPTEANNNRLLVNGSPISLERVVQAYRRTTDRACDKVYTELASKITGKENVVQKKTLEHLAHKTEEAINTEISSTDEVSTLISKRLIAYKNDKAVSMDATGMENALKKFVEETLNLPGSKEKAELWKATTANDGSVTYSPIHEAVSNLRDAILTSNNSGAGDAATNAAVTDAVTALVTALKARMPGSDDAKKETALLAKCKEEKGKDRLRSLLSSLRVKAEDSENLSKVLDLDKVVQVFEGSEGKKLQTALEGLSQPGTKFSNVKDAKDSNPEQFGEITALLFAKDDKGSTDESKRLTALVRIIKEAAGDDEVLLSSMTSHVVSKLKGNSVKSTEETALAVRLKKALETQMQAPNAAVSTPDPTLAQAVITAQTALDQAQAARAGMYSASEKQAAEAKVTKAQKELNDCKKPTSQRKTLAKQALARAQAELTTLTNGKTETSDDQVQAATLAVTNAREALRVANEAVATATTGTTPQALAAWIDAIVIPSQQRGTVLKETFQGMQRELDGLRGHFSAVAMRYFGDKEAYNKTLRPAVDDISRAAETVDKDDPKAMEKMREALKNNDTALSTFEQLVNGIQISPLKAPDAHQEHPGDIIDRIYNFLQSAIYNPILSLWKGTKSAVVPSSLSSENTQAPNRREEAKADAELVATAA